jgi:hypothetical protein
MSTKNRNGTVVLIISEEIKKEKIGKNKIWSGDHVLVIGIARSHGVVTPEIIVEKIQELND